MQRRDLLKSLATLGSALAGSALHAQSADFPGRSIRMVVGYPPGGPNDTIARALSATLNRVWNQPVVVENRPGAGGIIGSELVARAPADGHTLLLTSITHSILPSLYPNLTFDPVTDFTAVSLVANAPLLMVVHPSVQARSLKELVSLARTRPGTLNYASTGNATSIHIVSELFKRTAGLDITHVPYKGSAPAMTALLGGEVQMMIEAMPSALPHVQTGRLRALGVTSKERLEDMPDLPTLAESGLPGFEAAIWWGVVGPAKLPAAVLARLGTDIGAAVHTPEVRKRLGAIGVRPVGSKPAEFDRVIRHDIERFATVVKEAGIKVD